MASRIPPPGVGVTHQNPSSNPTPQTSSRQTEFSTPTPTENTSAPQTKANAQPPSRISPPVQESGSSPEPGTSASAAPQVRPKTSTIENVARSGTQGGQSLNPPERVCSPQRQLSVIPSDTSTGTWDSGQETDDCDRLCHLANPSSSSNTSDSFCHVANATCFSDTVSSDVVDSDSASASGSLDSGIGTTRFMDKKTFAFRKLSQNPGPKIVSKLVHKYGSPPPTDVQSAIEELHGARNEKKRQHTLQIVQTGLLPKLKQDHNLKDLAQCLSINDLDVQTMSATFLQAQLFHLDDRDNPALTKDLLMVAKTTLEAFRQGSDTDSHSHVLGYIHLLSVCALVTRTPRPTAEECSKLIFSCGPGKKKDVTSSGKVLMARGLNVFYKNFHPNTIQGKDWPIPVWKNVSWQQPHRVHRKNSFKKMTQCEQIVLVFSLLNEVARNGSSDLTRNLLSTMSDLKDVLLEDRKRDRDKEAFRFAFDLMLVRGLVFLLNSVFQEVMTHVGDSQQEVDHTQSITDLLYSIIKSGDHRLKDETYVLPFHSAPTVRKTFSYLLFQDNRPQCFLAIFYIKKYLQMFGFRMNTNLSVLGQTTVKQCRWYELECFFVQNKARLIALVPKHTCLATGPILGDCVTDHVKDATSGMKSEDKRILKMAHCRQQNIKMLVLLNSANSPSNHILRLYAYQYSPFPFCITEPIQDRRLLQFLLNHRHQQKWLDRRTLRHILKDIADGLIFLKQNNIMLRDITTYNMLVEGTPAEGMTLTDILLSGHFTVKLVDFGMAHRVNNNPVYQDQTLVKVAVEDQGPIPCRWIPHEALRQGLYSEKSMVYGLGCVTFELFTHGCQPFTSYDRTTSTEQLLFKILFDPESVSLHHWRCIPDDIFRFIRKCMNINHSERPTLETIATDLQTPERDRADIADSAHMGLDMACEWQKIYPPISPDQLSRRHEPERGIPAAVQRCIDNESMAYMNVQPQSRRSVKKSGVKKEELIAEDWMQITTVVDEDGRLDNTVVKEYVSETFISEVFALLEDSCLPGVDCWLTINKTSDTQQGNNTGLRLHERVYPYSIDLLSAAKRPEFWDTMKLQDPYLTPDSDNYTVETKYIYVFISLTQRLITLHEHRLCHCDVRACNVLFDCDTGEVILPRLGRVRPLPAHQDHTSTVVHDDSLRWYPPEVTLGLDYEYAQCCPASDVYMLGMTFWETFNIRQVVVADPAATDTYFVPFPDTPKHEVAEMSRKVNSLPQPANCPDWMFDLIKRCRHPDHASRPSCSEILQELIHHRASDEHPPYPFWLGQWMPTADDDDTESKPPALPKRGNKFLSSVVKVFRRSSKKIVSNFSGPGNRMSYALSARSLYDTFDNEETLPKEAMASDDYASWLMSRSAGQSIQVPSPPSDGGYLNLTDIDSAINHYSDGRWMPAPDYDQTTMIFESARMLDRWNMPVRHRSRRDSDQADQDSQDSFSIPRPDYFEYSAQSSEGENAELDTYIQPVTHGDRQQNARQQHRGTGRRRPLPTEWMHKNSQDH